MNIALIKLIIISLANLMCTTKVSEWVLTNTVPNRYNLVYYCNTPASESVKKQNASFFETIKSANVDFSYASQTDVKEPYFALYYGERLFSKFKSTGEMNNLSVSPLRTKIASELMSGKLCVMLYLTTDNKEKDEKGLKIIQKSISSSPFKDIITLVELSRNSVSEAHFASCLLNVESDLRSIPEPMVFGIFGRFKALEPLLGKGITEENINLMINFLTADCSCLIKDNLPGTDILFTDNWDNPAPALVNKILDANPSLVHK